MPNTFLLSEVHPTTTQHLGDGKPSFRPTDINSLAKYARFPSQKEFSEQLFLNEMQVTNNHINQYGGNLVIREHTHSDFSGSTNIPNQGVVLKLLKKEFKVNSLLTIRNPIDSYASLVAIGWVHFSPASFDEYCNRFLKMVEAYKDTQIVLYEDLVLRPHEVMRTICDVLEIQYSELFDSIFSSQNLTGDSGRKGECIEPRSRKPLNDGYLKEIIESPNFYKVSQLFPSYQLNK
jgi:hypothetical protein